MSLFTGLERPIPGFVETGEFALKRIERIKHQFPQFVEFIRGAIVATGAAVDFANVSGLADATMLPVQFRA